jgi:glycosyltransferase involved in cell wall biosynthesis
MSARPGIEDGPPLVGLVHRSPHHASHSGYGRLVEHFPTMTVADGVHSPVPYRIRKALAARAPGRSHSYDSSSFARELVATGSALRRRGTLVHYFDAERDAWAFPRWSHRLGARSSGSFHYPPDAFRRWVEPRNVQRLDAAVVLASNQLDLLGDLVGPERVHLVPLGVDVDFFRPPPAPGERDRAHVLFVGQHLRDFATFSATLDLLRHEHPDLTATAVLLAAFGARIPSRPWLTVRSGLDDDALRDLYCSASCLLLPLADAAACTAILEATACGLPVVTTDVGGTVDYLTPGAGTRCPPGDAESHAAAVHEVLTAPAEAAAHRSARARESAERFALPVVAAQLQKVFDSVAS